MDVLAAVAGVAIVATLVAVGVRLRRRRRAALAEAYAAPEPDADRSTLLGQVLSGSVDLLAGTVGGALRTLVQVAGAREDDGVVTLLFCDIEGSTRLNVELGDDRWAEVLRIHEHVSSEVVATHRGRIVKTAGDGFMAVFRTPAAGVRAAVGLQEALAANPRIGVPLPARIGVHCGEVIGRGGDFYGTEVVRAARIADRAKGAETLVSDAVVDHCGDIDGVAFQPAGRVRLKGLPGRQPLSRVAVSGPAGR
ncbi:adenylate/guanylate cyclase domain-containing protein [Euzebya rosea]|uniref:adenylate/guanylate cyclase domain-containing protein n=1 Tax=Euzebya rosea TaxID=2052804 RepID=UPI001300B792|nr:adenylate/guanylate cyclase domain-containing protein [Euzebya rosea]